MPHDIRPRRSVLYMPGSNARALEKARTLPADALILDLEDAVAPDAKEAAREQVCAAVRAGGYGPREVIIRINALSTPWGRDDLAAALEARPDAVLAPKISAPQDLDAVRAAWDREAGNTRLWIMMETPLAMLSAGAIAASCAQGYVPAVCMVMGTNDLAKETGASLGDGRAAMIPWLMTCVAAARAYGLTIIDGVCNDLSDPGAIVRECAQGRKLGMDGKTLIHPNQIEAANAAFAPSDDEVAWAKAVIDAFARPENEGRGALRVEGRMVELLHCEMARRTVSIADAIAARAHA